MKRDIDLINEAYRAVRKQSQLTEGREFGDYDAGKVRVGDVKAWEALLAAVEGDANIKADRFLQMWAQSTKQNPAGLDLDKCIKDFTSASGIGLAFDPTDNTLYVNDYDD